MTDGDVVAENERVFVFHHMQYRAILNICARADANVIHVAAHDAQRPEARVFADDHVADHDRGGGNIRPFRKLWVPASGTPNVWLASHLSGQEIQGRAAAKRLPVFVTVESYRTL